MKKHIPIILIFITVILYLLSILFFNKAFLPNTYINNVNYGFKTLSNAEYEIKNGNHEKKLELIKNDGTSETVDLSNLDSTVELNTDLNEILNKQDSFTWFISLFQKNYYEADVKITYDTKNLDNIISNLKCVTTQKASKPQNAYINKTEAGYEIVPETEGSLIDKNALKEAIINALKNNENSLNLSDNNCYQLADITTESEEIKQVINLLSNIDSLVITYDFDDRKEELTSDQINGWITINEDNSISVDEEKAKQFITNLAYKYDTFGSTRTFKTTDGNEVTLSDGIYGWQTDIGASTTELIETIKKCESTTIEPVYKVSGLCRATDDIGNTYVEVSIDKQHMWYYKNGELIIETDVVTGLPNGKRDTPKGVFCIWSREEGKTLGTYEVQGYESFVNYWMPIDWTGVGIHDATWRSNFGGTLYKSNGSHGCINTPISAVKVIFDNTVTGTPVIVY